MSDNETEKVSRVEPDVSSSDNESVSPSSSSSSPALPDTPPPSRSGSDASPTASLSASVSTINTSSTEYHVTSGGGCPLSDSDLSDPDESTDYEKTLNWRHLDQVPQETTVEDASSTQADTSFTSSSKDVTETTDENDLAKVSDDDLPPLVDDNEEDKDEEDDDLPPLVDDNEEDKDEEDDEDEDEDEESEENENDCDADDEECDSECESVDTYYVQLVPQRKENEYPPLLTFLFFLFLFLHLVHYMLLLKDSRNCLHYRP
jgi:hypothetical protein